MTVISALLFWPGVGEGVEITDQDYDGICRL